MQEHVSARTLAGGASNVTPFKSPAQTGFDVIIVGAGLSGIGAAFHLQRDCPKKSFIFLEARDALGGTWALFRYPGIRSDSDMKTLAFSPRQGREGDCRWPLHPHQS